MAFLTGCITVAVILAFVWLIGYSIEQYEKANTQDRLKH